MPLPTDQTNWRHVHSCRGPVFHPEFCLEHHRVWINRIEYQQRRQQHAREEEDNWDNPAKILHRHTAAAAVRRRDYERTAANARSRESRVRPRRRARNDRGEKPSIAVDPPAPHHACETFRPVTGSTSRANRVVVSGRWLPFSFPAKRIGKQTARCPALGLPCTDVHPPQGTRLCSG